MSVEWSVTKDALEGACRIISNVPPRNGVKASEYIKISKAGKDGAFFMLSSDMMSRAMIRTGELFPFEDDLFLDRRLFLPFVDAGKEGKSSVYLFIRKDDGKIIVKHGNRKAVYDPLKPVSGYEDVPEMPKARSAALDKKWIALVDAASDCGTDDPITPALNCVYISPTKKHLEILASNDRVVFRGKAPREKGISDDIAFPLMLIDSLRLDSATKLVWTNKVALIEFPKGKIWQAVKIQARKKFPHKTFRKMADEAEQDRAVLSINCATLSGTATRIAAYVAALSRDSLIFNIKLTKGSRNVVIESGSDSSKFQESLKMLLPSKEDLLIEWPLEQVMTTLIYIKDDGVAKIRISKEGRSCLTTKTVTLIVARREGAEKKEKNGKSTK